jgi:uncharacterized zinc-type alcohol dehydrogenase-like protein
MSKIQAYAAFECKGKLQPLEYEPGKIGQDQVEVAVSHCGICHSDLAMVENEWGFSSYPVVPGHEVIGTISGIGSNVKHLQVGQRVGVGWFSASCMTCEWCMSGNHNLCAKGEGTIMGRFGGFADRVRASKYNAIPLPEELDATSAAPLLCAGITVFNPLMQFDVQPTMRVGVIGIGGLGHLAIQFAAAWGCEVTAFSSTKDKEQEAIQLGADRFVASKEAGALNNELNTCDIILSTVTASLDWDNYLGILRPKGKLVILGVPDKPVAISAFSLIQNQKAIVGSPSGSPATIEKMLNFAATKNIKAMTESFPMSKVNDAFEVLKANKARYRIVLTN